MSVGVGGTGHMGVSKETTYGTYVAPTKYIPILSESLTRKQNPSYRKSIRGVAEPWGPAAQGTYHIEGHIKLEVTADALSWLMYGMRGVTVKTGTATPFTYTFTPGSIAKAPAGGTGLSISLQRAGGGQGNFGYTGCMITQIEFMFENGILQAQCQILGLDSVTYTPSTQTFAPQPVQTLAANTIKIGGSTRTDIDGFTLTIKDNAEVRNNIDGSLAATYVVFKDREVTGKFESDYDGSTTGGDPSTSGKDYNLFTAVTPSTLAIEGANISASNDVLISCPQMYFEEYPVVLAGLGDVVRAAVQVRAVWDSTATNSYTIVTKTSENIT